MQQHELELGLCDFRSDQTPRAHVDTHDVCVTVLCILGTCGFLALIKNFIPFPSSRLVRLRFHALLHRHGNYDHGNAFVALEDARIFRGVLVSHMMKSYFPV